MNSKTQYINTIEYEYNTKRLNEKLLREKTLLSNNRYSFTLQDLFLSNEIKSQAKLQNIINSIPLIHKDKILLFKTTTLIPDTYLNLNEYDHKFKDKLLFQNKIFKDYMREFRRIKDKKYIYISEITKSLNFHNHQISYFNSIDEIKQYIKHTFIAKSKNKYIGRTELKFDYKQKEQILKLFENFIIKSYGKLTIKPFKDFYIIPQSKIANGNFIKIDFIQKQHNENNYIERYLFKYLLKQKIKSKDEYVDSLDSKVCNILGIKQLTYSEYFFYDNLDSKTLFKLNDKLHSKIKYLNTDIDKKLTLYHTIEFLKDKQIYLKDNRYYFNSEDNILLDLDNKYYKQIYNSKLETLANKYINTELIPSPNDCYKLFATYIFHIYDYRVTKIYELYQVYTIDELSEYLKLCDELYEEEKKIIQMQQEDELYTKIDYLYYQRAQISDNLLISSDIDTLNIIDNHLENIMPKTPIQDF